MHEHAFTNITQAASLCQMLQLLSIIFPGGMTHALASARCNRSCSAPPVRRRQTCGVLLQAAAAAILLWRICRVLWQIAQHALQSPNDLLKAGPCLWVCGPTVLHELPQCLSAVMRQWRGSDAAVTQQ